MRPERLLTASRVCQMFSISGETLRIWSLEGFLPAEMRIMQNIRHYTIGAIDALLQTNARHFAVTPTALDLLAGNLTLVDVVRARAELGGISESVMFDRVESGRIAVVKLRGELRYSLQSIQQYNAGSSAARTDLLPRKTVMHILGISEPVLRALFRDGVLVCESVIDNLHLRPVTSDSLMALLSTLLPAWMDPADWVEDRLISEEPLVHAPAAMRMLEEDTIALDRLMEKRKLHYIYTPSGIQRQFSPESLAFYLANLPNVTSEEFALQFGVSVLTLKKWRREGILVCPAPRHVHNGEEWDMKHPCLIGILRTCLSPKIPVNAWYKLRLEGKALLLNADEAAKAIGIKYNDVIAMAESGEMPGLHSPGGSWQFTERQMSKVRKRLKWRA